MTDETLDLSGSDNPFLEPLAEHLVTDNIERRLARSPLSELDLSTASTQSRLDMLDRMQEEMFEPTETALQLVTHIFRLIRRGYIARDPSKAAVRHKTLAIANYSDCKIGEVPWFPTYAKGMRVSGETGTGKSYELLRGLELIPRTIVHRENRKAGWTHLVQVVWLYVAMSHDGSLGGLLLSILCALDEAAGTSYSTTKSITGLSNEKLAVRIGILLRTHGVGVLVIDELQSRNFRGAALGGLAATFFLRLLNFGIPMTVVGNPFGLAALDRYSQDMRRMSSGGSFDMRPMSSDDFDWTHCFAPALWRFDVMPEKTDIEDPQGAVLFKYSGGIRDYACRMRVASQRVALDLGARSVTMEHMNLAFYGNDFSDRDRAFVEAFRDKDAFALSSWEDVRWKEYAALWESPNVKSDPASRNVNSSDGTEDSQDVAEMAEGASKADSERDREQVTRKRSKQANALKKQSEIRGALDREDMRRDGIKEFLIAGMESFAVRGND